MNINQTISFMDIRADVAGQDHSPESRSSDTWIKNYLDRKNKRLNDQRVRYHNLLDQMKQIQPGEISASWRVDKPPLYKQDPRKSSPGGKWAVVSPEDEIISTWPTREEALRAAYGFWEGLAPSSTGATSGARVKRVKDIVHAADIFQDTEHGDKTRAKFLKHPKPQVVKLADSLRDKDQRPSSFGHGAAGSGGAAGPSGGSGGGT